MGKIEVLTFDGRDEWLGLRRKGVGGSDAAAAVGISPWTSTLDLYLEKIGEYAGQEENENMRRGTLLEPVVRQMYCDATGSSVEQPPGILHNDAYPWALANVDGLVGGNKLLECKTSKTRRGWGEPGSGEIPAVYLFQVMHYLTVCELDLADIAVMFGGFDVAIYTVEYDAEFADMLMGEEEAFWSCVQSGTPPEVVTGGDAIKRWPLAVQPSVAVATESDVKVASFLAAMKEHIAECDSWRDRAEAHLKARIGEDSAVAYGGDVLATWNNVAGRSGFDVKRLEKDHPELYAQYKKAGTPGRRFLTKEAPCLITTTLPEFQLPLLPPARD